VVTISEVKVGRNSQIQSTFRDLEQAQEVRHNKGRDSGVAVCARGIGSYPTDSEKKKRKNDPPIQGGDNENNNYARKEKTKRKL